MIDKICTVIIPISNTTPTRTKKVWKNIYQFIKETVENAGLDYVCKRGGSERGDIVAAIIRAMNESYLVIADMTDRNPNVFYELGVRHTLSSSRTLLITQTESPFDLKRYAHIKYTWDGHSRESFKKKLKTHLDIIDKQPEEPDSPVHEILKSQIKLLSKGSKYQLDDGDIQPQEWGVYGIGLKRNSYAFARDIETATSLEIIGGSLAHLYNHIDSLVKLLDNGGKVSIVMLPPYGINTFIQAKAHFNDFERYLGEVLSIHGAIDNLMNSDLRSRSLQLRVFKEPFVPYSSFTVWNRLSATEDSRNEALNSRKYVSFLPFLNVYESPANWPLIKIYKGSSPGGYEFFCERFERIWKDDIHTEPYRPTDKMNLKKTNLR